MSVCYNILIGEYLCVYLFAGKFIVPLPPIANSYRSIFKVLSFRKNTFGARGALLCKPKFIFILFSTLYAGVKEPCVINA